MTNEATARRGYCCLPYGLVLFDSFSAMELLTNMEFL